MCIVRSVNTHTPTRKAHVVGVFESLARQGVGLGEVEAGMLLAGVLLRRMNVDAVRDLDRVLVVRSLDLPLPRQLLHLLCVRDLVILPTHSEEQKEETREGL